VLSDRPLAEVVIVVSVVGHDADHRIPGFVPDGESVRTVQHSAAFVAVPVKVMLKP
jgi:hypothetical protein